MNTLFILGVYLTLISLFKSITNKNNSIRIPFKKKYDLNASLSQEEILKNLENNIIITEIEVGIPPQKLIFDINIKIEFSYILSNNTVYEHIPPKDYIEYNPNISQTYKKIKKTKIYYEFEESNYIQETIFFNGNNISNFNLIEPLYFYYSEDITEDTGLLGLGLMRYDNYEGIETNFIKNLKEKKLIKNYSFFFHFINQTDGEIIIGITPNEFNNTLYPYTYNTYSRLTSSDHNVRWSFTIDKLYYNNKEIKNLNTFMDISLNYGYIEIGKYYMDHITYLKELINKKICFISDIVCKKYICHKNKFNKKSFGILKIYNSQFKKEFLIDFSELFLDIGNYSYFLVGECVSDSIIVLGEPFLRKYPLLFDLDKKILSFYSDSPFKEGNMNKRLIIILIILCLFIIFISGLIYIIIIKNKLCCGCLKINKQKAIELFDDLDYQQLPK